MGSGRKKDGLSGQGKGRDRSGEGEKEAVRWQVTLTPKARKQLRGLVPAAQDRIVGELERLVANPYDAANVKKLKGKDAFRLRVGDYRVIYRLEGDRLVILVLRVGHRREVYRG